VCVFFFLGREWQSWSEDYCCGFGGEEGGERNGGDECVIIGASMID
jgi:hypothetical protein